MDVLAPEGYGEIIGGGQREDDYETVKNKILHHKLIITKIIYVQYYPTHSCIMPDGLSLPLTRRFAGQSCIGLAIHKFSFFTFR